MIITPNLHDIGCLSHTISYQQELILLTLDIRLGIKGQTTSGPTIKPIENLLASYKSDQLIANILRLLASSGFQKLINDGT